MPKAGPGTDQPQPSQGSFARGVTGPFGKFTEELKTHVDEHTLLLFLRWCAECDVKPGERLRDLVYLAVHGDDVHGIAAKTTRQQFENKGLNAAHFRRDGS